MKPKHLFLALVIALRSYGGEWFPTRIEAVAYPLLATQAGITGSVHLRITLDTQGTVSRVEVVSGNPVLARAAQSNLALWKFMVVPNSSPAPHTVDFSYRFELDSNFAAGEVSRFRYEYPSRVIVTGGAPHWLP